ncbi:MAG: hypothetical protein AAF196_01180 [Planctomycetota bacterium]
MAELRVTEDYAIWSCCYLSEEVALVSASSVAKNSWSLRGLTSSLQLWDAERLEPLETVDLGFSGHGFQLSDDRRTLAIRNGHQIQVYRVQFDADAARARLDR